MSSNSVAPAPQLTFPIKGYGSRPTEAISHKSTNAADVEDDKVVVSQEFESIIATGKELRQLDQQQRAVLLRGPVTKIWVDDEMIDTIPCRLFLVVSPKARDLYLGPDKIIPDNIEFDKLDKDAVKLLLHWAKETSTKKKCFTLKHAQDGSISADLILLQAADGLDMRRYINNIGKFWYKVITEPDRVPTADELNAVEEYCPAATNDKLFKAIAQRVAHCLVDEIVDAAYYNEYVAHFPNLAAAVTEFRDALVEKKKERLQRQEQRNEEKAAAAAARAASKEAKSAQGKAHRAAALEAMNGTGGVKVVTADEAAFLIRR